MRVTTVGVNFIARYPGRTFQPYVAVGVGAAIAHIGDTATVRSDTDVPPAWNVLAGLRAFMTPKIAVFREYKYTGATFKFDQAFGALVVSAETTEHSMSLADCRITSRKENRPCLA